MTAPSFRCIFAEAYLQVGPLHSTGETLRGKEMFGGNAYATMFLTVIAALFTAPSSMAASGTWLSNATLTTMPWNASSSWVGGTIPGSTSVTTNSDTATFNAGANTVTVDSARNLRTITFDTSAGAFIIGSAGANAGNALNLTSGATIQIASTFAGSAVTETINAPLQLWGTSAFTSSSADSSNKLNFAGGITGGTSSAVTLTLGGVNAGSNTISGVISNGNSTAVSITKSGAGTWVLSGPNTYNGTTTITAGMLKITSDASLGSAPGSVTAGNIVLNNSNPTGAILASGSTFTLNSNRGITLGSATAASGGALSVAQGTTLTYGGVIAGGGSSNNFSKLGSGTLTLTGANTYAGTTVVSAGTLKLDFSASGAPIDNILASGGNLTVGGAIAGVGIAASDTLSIVGSTTNTQTVGTLATQTGASHINLAAGSGTLTLATGTMAVRSIGSTLDISTTGSAVVTTTASNVTQTGCGLAMVPLLLTLNGVDFATINAGQIVALSPGNYTTNTGTTLGGQGTVVDMTTASTTISSNVQPLGDLRFNTPQNTTITLGSGLYLAIGGGNTVAGQILETANVGSHTATITGGVLQGVSSKDLVISQNNTAGSMIIGSAITDFNGNGTGFTKSGAGTLILNATNAYVGASYINEGNLVVAGDYVASQSQSLTTTSGSNTISGVDTSNLYIGERVTAASITGTASGAFIVSMTGNGAGNTITLSATSNSTATGTVSFLGGSALGVDTGATAVSSSIQLANGATLQIGNGGTHGSLFAGQAVSNYGTVVLNRSDDFIFSNVITNANSYNSMGAGALTKLGSNTATLNVLNTYQGATTISAGILSVGSGSSAALSSTIGTATNNSNVITGITTAGLAVGQSISGTGIPVGAVIVGINSGASTITVSMNANSSSGTNTYTFNAASPLANGGVASAIGMSSSAAANLVLDAGTLQYTGSSAASTDRLFTLTQNGGGLDASGASNAAVSFTNTGAVAFSGSGLRTLALSGSSTGNNTLAAVLGDGTGGATSLTKSGTGTWVITGANTYTGETLVSAGMLMISAAGSINSASGGVRMLSSATLTNNNNSVACIGSLALEAGATLNGTGSFAPTAMTLSANLSGGPGSLITLSTSLTKAGDLRLTLTGVVTTGDYYLFTGGSTSGSFANMWVNSVKMSGAGDFTGTDGAGNTYSFTNSSNLLQVTTPEPSTWILLTVAGTFFMLMRRRRQG